LTRQPQAIYIRTEDVDDEEESHMAVHLTPTELADELNLKRREVIAKCLEMHVPILNGRIDRTLFESSLRAFQVAAEKKAAV
jgi:hypothetical protein